MTTAQSGRLAAPIAVPILAAATGPAALRPSAAHILRAETFIRAMGVNIHVGETDTPYRNLSQIIAALRDLGTDNVRDSAQAFPPGGNGRFARLARAGLQFDFILRGSIGTKLRWLDSLEQRFAGSVSAIEGPNEVNNWPVRFDGKTGTAAAVAFQAKLYAAVKADPVLAAVPVYNFTDYPAAAGRADFANIHPYPKHGRQPMRALTNELARYSRLMPGKPVVITEAGYPTLTRPTRWGGVDPETQARLTVDLLLDAAALGIRRVYLYQLFDGPPDPSGTSPDRNLGLFNRAAQPKPAARAIHNLTNLFRDGSAQATQFQTRSVALTIRGEPQAERSLVFEKANGAAIIALWTGAPIWNPVTFRPIVVAPHALTLLLGGTRRRISVYDPLLSRAAQTTARGVDRITVMSGADPLFIAVSPG